MEKIIIIIASVIFQLVLIYAINRWGKENKTEESKEIKETGEESILDEKAILGEEDKTEKKAPECDENKNKEEDELLIAGLEKESSLDNKDKDKIGKDEESELLKELSEIEGGEEEKDPISEYSTDDKAEDILGELKNIANKLKRNKA
ncbi:MAG: hypothetical protein KJ714_07515 [Euryarchaeota archaeon]|nr:hypothetical protein [Euryarchaeota archaeon]